MGLRNRRFQAQLSDTYFSHPKFLDLASDGGWEFLHEFDVMRDLVVHDLTMAEGADFGLRQRHAVLGLDPGHDLFAVISVRHTNDISFGNLRMGEEELFDFTRENLFA